ncbi:MAG: phosphoribosylanthranilate isomerase [Planctomycetaceae bacterium]|nr:phosphoribosylanthranilate isomerase [Planctomycetaceae bacterium]
MWIKICGITRTDEAARVAELLPDAIGLNFHARSPRCVDETVAREICALLPEKPLKVGVFVEQSPKEIQSIAQRTGLDLVQLHGDYTPDQTMELRDVPFIWVYRLGGEGLQPLRQSLEEFAARGVKPFACLIDARVPGMYGGSGETVDWPRLASEYDTQNFPPLILAGGLNAENVAEAVRTVNPWGIDVASGVETAGRKDPRKCQQFLEQARKSAAGQESPPL